MPRWPQPQPEHAGVLGLAHAQGQWHLAAVDQNNHAAPRVIHEAHTPGTADGLRAAWLQLIAGLDEPAKHWPIAWTLPPGRALHRRITLPPADAATTDQLVAVRAEALLPGQAAKVRHGWARDQDNPSSPTWVVLVAQDAVECALHGMSFLKETQAANELCDAVPAPVALAAAQPEKIAGMTIALLDTQTAVVHYDAHGLIDIAEVDGRPKNFQNHETDWLASLDDALNDSDFHTAASQTDKTSRVTWIGSDITATDTQRWSAALNLPHATLSLQPPGAALARGAAIAAMDSRWPTIRLTPRSSKQAQGLVTPRSWALAVVALMLALGLWVWSDLHAAAAIAQAHDQHDSLDERAAALSQQLALLNHLEQRPPTLLAMLDEFTDKSKDFRPKTLHYDADGDLEIAGQLSSPGKISELVAALAQTRTLASARLRSQKRAGDDGVAYEIVATPSDRFFEAFVPVPKIKQSDEETSETPKDESQEDSKEKPKESSADTSRKTSGDGKEVSHDAQ